MSGFFGMGRPQQSSAERIAAAETEIELFTDMFQRLSNSCTKKCVPADYREGDLNKGESVCIDRCVAKFFEVNMKVSEKMQNAAQGAQAGGGGGGMFGM
ncbi:Mitochondrial import inner membrane translocase subunit tim10 [Cyphellophora attinorum]|uniref:Mitochondrial import inner membrane translocase subunit n=1 Tax=Cyphellophora attinorum TaxID=1664694 RepID=A0A0N1H9Z4_9EURO|nr:Mitochondrial import inner membrane translocase subunit tim10 [Phialophora attinorum]KPI44622.1 Mitochondrial import inner membrane translocase subunit tim10 [Phialophora attinorum]